MIFRLIRSEISASGQDITETSSPTPSQTLSLTATSSTTPSQTLSLSCPPYGGVQPIAIPEYIAQSVRDGNQGTYNAWIVTQIAYPYDPAETFEQPLIDLCNSVNPTASSAVQMIDLIETQECLQSVNMAYAGSGKGQTTVPGVVVLPQTVGPGQLPKLPDYTDFDRPIIDDLRGVLTQPEIDIRNYNDQITGQLDQTNDDICKLVGKVPGKIGDQLVDEMGCVYGTGMDFGFDVPTIDDIMSGDPRYNPPTTGGGYPLPIIDTREPRTGGGYPLPEIDTRTPTTGGGYPLPNYPTPTPTPTPTDSSSCPVPIINFAPPAQVCPAPPDINFAPVINITVPGDDTPTTYTVTPTPTPTPDLPDVVVVETPIEPPPVVAPVVPPVVVKNPPPAPLAIPPINLAPNPTMWELGAACVFPANPGKFDSRLLWALFGWTNVSGNEYKPPGWLDPANYPFGSQWVGSALMNTFGLGIQTLNKASQASQPITNNFQDFMVLAMGGVVEKWIGAPVLPFLQGTIYNINYHNPQLLPGIPDLQNLFKKGAISEEIFRCLVRANGSYDSWQMKIAESSTLVPSLFDIIRLYRGKKIGGNEFEYYANLNGLKIATQQGKQDIATFLEATRAIPGVADLVRMMVRDAADDKIAAKYGTDTDLGNKFAGQIEGWSEQQGVDPEIMKYYWRAHWEIPSNTQLFDMLHKLRPNRRVGNVPANIVTTADDVKQAIQVNDLTPYWVDRVMATSYSSLTRIDAQRAFFIEAINEDQLFDAYMDIGYNSDNAQVLVDFTKELKRKRDANLPGADKPANIISQLKKYVISETAAYDRLRDTGMKPEKAKKAVSNSVRDRKEEARVKCLKEAQRRFFRAEYDLLKYKSVVMQLGIPQENIEALVNETACLYDSRGKELNAGALCKAFSQNIIAFDQFQNRLQLIGYDKDEAYIIAESCQIDKVVAIGKAKLAKEAKEKAEAEKAKKAVEKEAKDAEKKAEKAKKAQEAEEKKKAKDNPPPV